MSPPLADPAPAGTPRGCRRLPTVRPPKRRWKFGPVRSDPFRQRHAPGLTSSAWAPRAPRVLDVFFVADRSFPRACFLLVQTPYLPARSQTDIDALGLQDDRMTLSTIGISCTEYRFVPRTAKRRFGRTRACSGPCRGSSISNSFRSQRSASLQKSKNRVSPPLSPSHPRQSAPWVLACSTVRPTPLTALASL